MKNILLALAAVGFTATMGETYTWCGPDNGTWKAPTNWSPALPAEGAITAADTLVFANSTALAAENDIANLEVAALRVTGAGNLSLTGGKVTISGTAGLYKEGAAATATFGLPIDFAGSAQISLKTESGTNIFNGVVGGAAPILVHGKGAVHLKAANTFTGALTFTNGHLHVWNDLAFGATSAGMEMIKKETLTARAKEHTLFLHGVTLDEPIVFNSSQGSYDQYFVCKGTTNVLNNVVSRNIVRGYSEGDSQFIFGGSLDCRGWFIPDGTGATMDRPIIFDAEGAYVPCLSIGGSYTIIKKPVDTHVSGRGGLTFYSSSGNIKFLVDDAATDKTSTDSVAMGNVTLLDMKNNKTTFDFTDTVQHFKGVVSANASTVFKGTAGSRLVVYNTSADTTSCFLTNPEWGLCGKFEGEIDLMCDGQYRGVAGAGTTLPLVLVNRSTSTGTLFATNGATVCISNNAAWAGVVRVSTGSRLELRNTAALGEATAVYLDDTSKIVFPEDISGDVRVLRVKLGDTQLAFGTWGAVGSGADHETAAIEGAGTITVTSGMPDGSDGVWTGGAGVDTAFATGGNWQAGTAPEATGGDSTITVTGGETMSLAGQVAVKHIAFDPAVAAFTFADANGMGALRFVADTRNVFSTGEHLVLPGTRAEERTCDCTFAVPVTLVTSAFTNSVPCSNQTVRFTRPVSSMAPVTWSKTGAGKLYLPATNTFIGTFTCDDGEVHVYGGESFGNAANTVKLMHPRYEARTRVYFHGGTYPQTFEWDAWGLGLREDALIYQGGTNVFLGEVKLLNCIRYSTTDAGSCTIYAGGITGGQFMPNALPAGASIVVTNKPMNTGDVQFTGLYKANPAIFELCVSSNAMGSTYFMVHGNTYVKLNAHHALCRAVRNTPLTIDGGGESAVVDLCGFDQQCQLGDWNSSGGRGYSSASAQVTSPTPAVLDVKQESREIVWCSRFMGGAGIVKSGTKDVTLSNSVDYASSTTGTVAVAEGNLTLCAKVKLPNLGKLGVTGGVLMVETGAVINEKVDVELESAGKLNLAAGVAQRVRYLRLAGVEQRRGTYGGTGSGAKYVLPDYFTGKGRIFVNANGPGICLSFR